MQTQSVKNRLNEAASTRPEIAANEAELKSLAGRLRSISERGRKLLVQIAELAYHGRGDQRKPDVAYLPELYECTGLGVEEMYPLLEELKNTGFIAVEDRYPFEDVKILPSTSGWNALAALAQFAEAEKIPLRDLIVDLRFPVINDGMGQIIMKASSHNGTATEADVCNERNAPASPLRNGDHYLQLLGESVRAARARRGMTRKMLAQHSGVSERFLAQLESGAGNASILVLRQIATALDLPLEGLLPNGNPGHADLQASVALLQQLDAKRLGEAHDLLRTHFGGNDVGDKSSRIALIGLRGAGKSTIGKLLAENLGVPFFELDRLIEQASGLSLGMIFDMYGQSGFRRFERRCLEDLLSREEKFVLATGGSLVSEPATYDRLLGACRTVWLRATPQEHMSRVIAQGDMRPMAHSREAMADLERILSEREQLYSKADITVETSGRAVEDVLKQCMQVFSEESFRAQRGIPSTPIVSR